VTRYCSQYCLISRTIAAPGETLFTIDGKVTAAPSSHSVQVGRDLHVDLPEGLPPEEIMDRFPWRFMNHSCAPNAAVHGWEVVALRQIVAGEEITFDYNTTEYHLAAPFTCLCSTEHCIGEVRGFRFLTEDRRERLHPLLADHLLAETLDPGDGSRTVITCR
jgi:hypothetical protein